MFYQLPPVGNSIRRSVTDQPDVFLNTFFLPYKAHYFTSGTAALAAAIIAAIRFKGVGISTGEMGAKPEVILPAYGCPDLISAVIFAGATPVLVDLEPDRPWMDLKQLAEKFSKQTVAVVAVNLFGILERMHDIRILAEQAGALVIEDSAQAFPSGAEQDIWTGDLVVLSFGRGKPVSLLGGGAVLCREERLEELDDFLAEPGAPSRDSAYQRISLRLKIKLYNWMISPWLYWLPQGLPLLNLGETRFHPLLAIDAISSDRLGMLPANITAYQGNGMNTQVALTALLAELNFESSSIIDLPSVCQNPSVRRLLRYPLLVEEKIKSRLLLAFRHEGLGASEMYPEVLSEIPGLEKLLAEQGPFPAARSFAARIMTLPTSTRVAVSDINKIRQLLVSCR